MNNVIKGKTFASVYQQAMQCVMHDYDYESAPRGQKIRECLNVILELEDPTSNLFVNAYRSPPLKYLKNELLLYLSGRNDRSGFERASKFWGNIANDDGTINSAYGHLIWNCYEIGNNSTSSLQPLTQFDWACKALCADKDSRQAIIHYNKPCHQKIDTKDFPCTLNNIFSIRDNKLFMTTIMRSNDLRRGLQFDLPFFTLVQWLMYLRLKPMYSDLKLGSYTHIANSLHVYETDFEMMSKMLEAEMTPASMPLPDSIDIIMSKHIIEMSYGKQYGTCADVMELFENAPAFYHNSYTFIEWLNNR